MTESIAIESIATSAPIQQEVHEVALPESSTTADTKGSKLMGACKVAAGGAFVAASVVGRASGVAVASVGIAIAAVGGGISIVGAKLHDAAEREQNRAQDWIADGMSAFK